MKSTSNKIRTSDLFASQSIALLYSHNTLSQLYSIYKCNLIINLTKRCKLIHLDEIG